jgi:hypothetical protein
MLDPKVPLATYVGTPKVRVVTPDGKKVIAWGKTLPNAPDGSKRQMAAVCGAFTKLKLQIDDFMTVQEFNRVMGGNGPPRYNYKTGTYYDYGAFPDGHPSGVVICTNQELLVKKTLRPDGTEAEDEELPDEKAPEDKGAPREKGPDDGKGSIPFSDVVTGSEDSKYLYRQGQAAVEDGHTPFDLAQSVLSGTPAEINGVLAQSISDPASYSTYNTKGYNGKLKAPAEAFLAKGRDKPAQTPAPAKK